MITSFSAKVMTIGSMFIFVLIMFVIYRPRRNVSKEIIKINNNYSATITTLMITFAVISSVVMYYFSPDTVAGITVFVLVFYLLPYAVLSSEKRKHEENIFKNILIYVNNSIVIIRQEKNVFKTLLRVSEDLDNPLKEDVERLVEALEEDLSISKKIFKSFEEKYNYTIIKQLDVLLLKMHYEDSSIREEVLTTLSKDAYQLSNDIEDNRSKRTILRLEFIGISIACMFIYFAMMSRFKESNMLTGFDSELQIINILYIVSVVVTLFFVDQYFNSHLMKE